jgi:GntR family transcriptional regulator
MWSPLPKYFLVRRILEARLDREYAPGARIPSEADLCHDFAVSRVTIQQALTQLEKEGRIRREQGRGTFYVGSPSRLTETKPSELLESVLKYREGAYMDVLRHAPERATPHVAQRLNLVPGAPVVAVERLTFVDHQPIAFIEAYLPEPLGAELDGHWELLRHATLASVLKDRRGVDIDAVVQTIGASLADPKFAHHLGIEAGAPVLEGERTYMDSVGRPVFLSLAFYRADRHRFVVTLKEWR